MSVIKPKHNLIHSLILSIALLVPGFSLAGNSASALSMMTFKRLVQVEELLHKDEFSKAQAQLDRLLRGISRLSLPDRAYTYHMQALLYLYQQQYAPSRKYFLLSYQQKHDDKQQDDGQHGLNDRTRLQVVQMLANLALHAEDYQQAVKFSQEYLQMASDQPDTEPSRTGFLILASAYYQLAEYAKAIKPLKQVIELFAPDKAAYSTLFVVYYQLKRLPEATSILEKMIRIWPDKAEYWLQLASIYLEQDLYVKSLEIMQLSFVQGFLIRENEFMQYVYTLYDKNLPNKAAIILSAAMEKSIVKQHHKNHALLASLYTDAKEEEKALLSFKKAAGLSTSGREYLYVAQIYYDRERYQQSIKYARDALEKGIEKPGNVHMLIAASYHELDNIPATMAHLNKAANYKETKKTARQWLLSVGAENIPPVL